MTRSPSNYLSTFFYFNESRFALISVGIFSSVVNILYLTSAIYMLQVYDRVLSSRSIPTLIALSLGALFLYLIQAALDIIRNRILTRIAFKFEESLAPKVFRVILELPRRSSVNSSEAMQPLRDLDALRSFLASGGPIAFFDIPWMPIYLIVIFLLHPTLGWFAAFGIFILLFITALTNLFTKKPTLDVIVDTGKRWAFLQTIRENSDVIYAMGLTEKLLQRWQLLNKRFILNSLKLSDISGALGGIGRSLRIILQSAILGLGAYLVINGEGSGGAMIAASILMTRALAPIELAIAHWKGFISAQQGATRLRHVLELFGRQTQLMPLPPPKMELNVNALFVGAPSISPPLVQKISFRLKAGEAMGIVGPSASGKSTLVRALVGVWRPSSGEIRLDGAALDQWEPSELGQHIGYLPQEIELFEGSIAENIARFKPDAKAEDIIKAAREADVHEMILRLEKGYETQIGEGGYTLSAGQRQRIALARALFGSPFFVVLDEPNSNLDSEGDTALMRTIARIKARKGIVVIIAHRIATFSFMDYLLVLNRGQMQHYGPKEDILRILTTHLRAKPLGDGELAERSV